MTGAQGTYLDINEFDYTTKHPWYQDFMQTSILQSGETAAEGGVVTCTMNRQFETIYSDIVLEDWMELRGKYGFKIYNNTNVVKPFPKGFVHDYKVVVVDSARPLFAVAMLSTLVVGLLV